MENQTFVKISEVIALKAADLLKVILFSKRPVEALFLLLFFLSASLLVQRGRESSGGS